MSHVQGQPSKEPSPTALRPVVIQIAPQLIRAGCISEATLPFVIEANNAIDLIEWSEANRAFIETELLNAGAILFRNFRLMTVDEFERLVETVSGPLLDYSYRSTPRTRVSGKIYTSTEYPPHQSIPLHNENAYSRSWPMKLWFFSVQVADEGGETPIADSRKIYQNIPVEIRESFERKGLMYVRNYGSGLDLSWREVFQTASRAAVEDYCRNAGIELQWIGEDQLRTRQRCQVIERHPRTGETVWFNQAHLFHLSRLPEEVRDWLLSAYGEENLPRNVYHADGSAIDAGMLEEISATYDQNSVIFPWREGDVLFVDNMLAAHGRRPFRGTRRVVVGMAEPNKQSTTAFSSVGARYL